MGVAGLEGLHDDNDVITITAQKPAFRSDRKTRLNSAMIGVCFFVLAWSVGEAFNILGSPFVFLQHLLQANTNYGTRPKLGACKSRAHLERESYAQAPRKTQEFEPTGWVEGGGTHLGTESGNESRKVWGRGFLRPPCLVLISAVLQVRLFRTI